jgi:hypothetical protein
VFAAQLGQFSKPNSDGLHSERSESAGWSHCFGRTVEDKKQILHPPSFGGIQND